MKFDMNLTTTNFIKYPCKNFLSEWILEKSIHDVTNFDFASNS